MSENNLEATSFDSKKANSSDTDVDDLVASALKELGTKQKPVVEEKKEMAAAHMAAPFNPQPTTPEQKTTNIKPQTCLPAGTASKEEQAYEKTFKDYRAGGLVTGKIVSIDQGGALVDIGYKSDGFIPREELTPELKAGDKVNAVIEKLETKEGYVLLSKKIADHEIKWEEAYNAYKTKKLLEAKVTGAVKGGLVADFSGLRGFIPASQVLKSPEAALEDFVGKALPVKIIEINRRQSKIVLSHKLAAVEHEKKEATRLIDELEVGQVRRGKVKNLKTFGAFIDLGGIEGLIHLSELSWKRVKHPSEVLKTGQEIDVFVLGVDKINNKVSLGLKELQTDPWSVAGEKYKPGQTIKVKVLRLTKFGAFVEIEEGLEGLIHLSELSKDRVEIPDQAVKPGDIVEVKILRIMPDEQKIGLSIKEVQLDKEKALALEQKQAESRVTIAEMIAEKERQKAEREEENAPPPQE